MDTLNVLHISASDTVGGAAIACIRLHKAMLKFGLNSNVLVQRKATQNERVHNVSDFDQKYMSSFRRYYNSRIIGNHNKEFGSFSANGIGASIVNHKLVKQADVIYLHYVNSGFLNVSSILELLKTGKRVVWFLHDMWPLTGGCHHSFDCDKFTTHCGLCPQLSSTQEKDLAFRIFEKKLELKKYSNLSIITPSTWLGQKVSVSAIFKDVIYKVIPNVLDQDKYFPFDQIVAKQIFNLPRNKKILLFGAVKAINNPYKGWKELVKALNLLRLPENEIEVVVFGSEEDSKVRDEIPYHVTFVGYLYDDYSLNALYNAADVFILPSLADNFPNTLLEAGFSGCPSVAYGVGGVPDLVVTGENGYLAKERCPSDLAEGIDTILLDSNLKRNKIVREFKSIFDSNNLVDRHVQRMTEL